METSHREIYLQLFPSCGNFIRSTAVDINGQDDDDDDELPLSEWLRKANCGIQEK
jgi:hypothetical protein